MKVPFGFADIDAEQKTGAVRALFNQVAGRYDLMNDAMSLGVHRLWKAAAVRAAAPQPGERVLDLAAGTGDIAAALMHAAGGCLDVTLCDLSESMLRAGRERSRLPFTYVAGNAECLPFASGSFDLCTIAFGLRNVTHPQTALREIHRVLRVGGRFVCLEFSQPTSTVVNALYNAYSFKVIPQLGQLLANDRASYAYLVESIRRFPPQEALAEMLRTAGFADVQYQNLSNGIAALHMGRASEPATGAE